MPYDLSQIIDYCRECIIALLAARKDIQSGTSTIILLPVLAERTLSSLQALIEQLDDEDQAKVCKLLEHYQIHHSRFKGTFCITDDPVNTAFVSRDVSVDQIIRITMPKTLELHLIADSMFEFARQYQDHIPPLVFSDQNLNDSINGIGLRGKVSEGDMRVILKEIPHKKVRPSDQKNEFSS